MVVEFISHCFHISILPCLRTLEMEVRTGDKQYKKYSCEHLLYDLVEISLETRRHLTQANPMSRSSAPAFLTILNRVYNLKSNTTVAKARKGAVTAINCVPRDIIRKGSARKEIKEILSSKPPKSQSDPTQGSSLFIIMIQPSQWYATTRSKTSALTPAAKSIPPMVLPSHRPFLPKRSAFNGSKPSSWCHSCQACQKGTTIPLPVKTNRKSCFSGQG